MCTVALELRGEVRALWPLVAGWGWEGITESHSSGTEQDTGEAKGTRKRLSWGPVPTWMGQRAELLSSCPPSTHTPNPFQ